MNPAIVEVSPERIDLPSGGSGLLRPASRRLLHSGRLMRDLTYESGRLCADSDSVAPTKESPNMLFLISTVHAIPFDTAMDSMTAAANVHYPGATPVDSGPIRLSREKLDSKMQTLIGRLEAGGCTTTLEFQEHVGGAYQPGIDATVGTSDSTTFVGTVPGPGSFSGSLVGQAEVGDNFSSTNRNGQLIADRDDGSFFAGVWTRVQGTRGIFLAAMGSCDGGNSAAEALDSWYRGDLSGWVEISSTCIEYSWDFNDDTLQGWTSVGVYDAYSDATTDTAHEGGFHLTHSPFNTRDLAHPTSIVTSPSFELHPNHSINFFLMGGESQGFNSAASGPASVDDLDSQSSSTGLMGVGLRPTASPLYLETVARSSNFNTYQQLSISPAVVENNAGELVSLELYDSFHGGWGWIALDSVSITCIDD